MILGIDPGLANTGWAVLADEHSLIKCGCLVTKIKDSTAERLLKIYEEIDNLIKQYGIGELAIESLFFAKNEKSAMKVAEAIGVIKLCGAKNGIKVVDYTPMQVKMALVGYGKAEKQQVEMMVRTFLNLDEPIHPSHASDAVAVALTSIFTMRIE